MQNRQRQGQTILEHAGTVGEIPVTDHSLVRRDWEIRR